MVEFRAARFPQPIQRVRVERRDCNAPQEKADIHDSETTKPKQQPKRRILPSNLPRDRRAHKPASTQCLCCGRGMAKLGEDIREILDFNTASFIVRHHIIKKFVCRNCDAFVEGELPSQPIEKGMTGAGLLAHVLVPKYADSLLLYRQLEVFARHDVDIVRSTMTG